MDTLLEPRPVLTRTEDSQLRPLHSPVVSAQQFVMPSSEPAKLSSLDIVAGALMAVMMIGPLAAAAIGRMAT